MLENYERKIGKLEEKDSSKECQLEQNVSDLERTLLECWMRDSSSENSVIKANITVLSGKIDSSSGKKVLA